MPKLMRRAVVLAKNEATSGTDPVPTGALNAILVRNLMPTPVEMQVESRELIRPYLGNSDQIIVSKNFKVEFEVELAGAGAPGTVPKYGALLRGCAFSETVAAGVSVTYAPVSTGMETLTLYVNIDGVLHKSVYVAGSVAFSLDAGKSPFMKFSFTGLFVPVADAAAPSPTYTGFQKPVAVNKANTPTFTLHGFAAVMQSLQCDMKNEVPYRNLVNTESVSVTDRKPDGSVSMEAVSVATKDWWSSIVSGTTGALQLIHGTAAGNTVQLDAPTVQIFQPTFADSQGVQMLQANLVFLPGASGNDELTLTVK